MKTIKVKHWEDRPDNFTGIAINQFGQKAYFQNDQYHRLDGPACEWTDGGKEWWQNGKLHQLNGPAVEYTNGHKAYYQNGKRHRLDGPAVELPNGNKAWFVLGQGLTEKQHNLFRKLWDQTDVDKTEKAMMAYVTLVKMGE